MRRSVVRLGASLAVAVGATLLPAVPGPREGQVRHWSLAINSGVIQAPAPSGLVAVTWPAGRPEPERVEVRTTPDGRSWTGWTPLEHADEDTPDIEGPERGRRDGTAPLWVGRAVAVKVRFAGNVPAGARLSLVDPGPDPAPGRLPSLAASPAGPAIVSRAQWGADESLRRGPARYAPELRMAFVHHTATGNGYGPADTARIVRSIHAYHVRGRGWDDIGYNLLVDRYGQVFEGRAGGVHRPVVGAHAQGFNHGSAGISLIGTFSSVVPPQAMLASLRDALAWKLDLHLVDPKGAARMRSGGSPRHPAGADVTLPVIAGHRDTGDTDCPGGRIHERLPWLREEVARTGDPKTYAPRFVPPAFTPNGDGVGDQVEIGLRFSSPVSWHVEIAGSDGRVVRAFQGSGQASAATWDGRDAAGLLQPHGRYGVRVKASNDRGSTRPVTLPVDLWAWPDGTALTDEWTGAAHVLEAGRLRHVPGWRALVSRMSPAETVHVPGFVTSLYPAGPPLGFREGAILRAGGRLWLLSSGKRRPASPEVLQALGFDPQAALDADAFELAVHPEGAPVDPAAGMPDGSLLRGPALAGAWKLDGTPRLLVSEAMRSSHGIREVDLARGTEASLAASGALVPVGFRDGTLLTTPGTRVWVISGGTRRWISSAERFTVLGYRWENVRHVSEAEAALHPEGAPV